MAFPGYTAGYGYSPYGYGGYNPYYLDAVNAQRFRYQGTNSTTSPNLSDPFAGKGNDFLDPDFVGGKINDYSMGLDDTTIYFHQNPDAENILEGTDDAISRVFNTNYFYGPTSQSYLTPYNYNGNNGSSAGAYVNSRGLFSSHPSASGILFDVTSYSNAITNQQSPFNYPVAWQPLPYGGVVPYDPTKPSSNLPPIIGFPTNYDPFNPHPQAYQYQPYGYPRPTSGYYW